MRKSDRNNCLVGLIVPLLVATAIVFVVSIVADSIIGIYCSVFILIVDFVLLLIAVFSQSDIDYIKEQFPHLTDQEIENGLTRFRMFR